MKGIMILTVICGHSVNNPALELAQSVAKVFFTKIQEEKLKLLVSVHSNSI